MPKLRLLLLLAALVALSACGGLAAPAPTSAPAAAQPSAPPATAAPSATSAPPTTTPWPTSTPLPTAVPNTLFVDPAQQLGPISRLVYGTNIGPWTGIPLDEQKDVAAAGLTFLRFPGGEWGDQNNLDSQQIDDYIARCRALKAEPSISVRLRGGTPAQAADLVSYVNQKKHYQVRYWSIGNEPTLFADYDIARYNSEWRAIAQAMRAVDPSIQLLGPEVHQFDPQGATQDVKERYSVREFVRAFLKANGDLVDIVAIHRYPFPLKPNDADPTIAMLRDNSREWDAIIPNLRALIRETIGRDLPVAVTEVNSNWSSTFGGDATPDSHYGAIWWGDVLGRLIRQRVEIVAQFAIHGPESQGWGLVHVYKVRPAYYVYRMYQHFGDQLIYASSDDPLISIFAARRADGALTLMLVNLSSEARAKPLRFVHFAPTQTAETYLFDQDHNAEQFAATALDGTPLRLPPESMTLLVVKGS